MLINTKLLVEPEEKGLFEAAFSIPRSFETVDEFLNAIVAMIPVDQRFLRQGASHVRE